MRDKYYKLTVSINFRVQELFKLSLTSTELRLRISKSEGLRRPPAPIYPHNPDDKENVSMVECEQKRTPHLSFPFCKVLIAVF